MSLFETAKVFFEACEPGTGWADCAIYCTSDATFAYQADALADTTSLSAYCDWMKGLLTRVPDGRYVLSAFAMDEARGTAVAAAVFRGTHTGEGGPVAPTGKEIASDYAYVMMFDGTNLGHVTKIWNDLQAMKALGWA